jgi:RecB family exonuclease
MPQYPKPNKEPKTVPTPKQGYTNKAGVAVPGCTTVLNALSGAPVDALLGWAAKLAHEGLDWKSERQRSADVGTLIHDILEKYPDPLPARPPWTTPDEWARVQAAYGAYAAWDADIQPVIVAQEVQLVSEELQAGGTFDLIAKISGVLTIADHKTGKSIDVKKIAAQLAMYAHTAYETGLVKEPIKEGLILHYPMGRFKPVRINEAQMTAGLELFKIARAAYAAFKDFPR